MNKSSLQSGFTLVELLVSLSLFTIIVVAAVGSLYTVNQASVKVNAMRTTLDNLNFAVESISRTLRTGSNIVCGGTTNPNYGTVDADHNCAFGANGVVGHKISLTSTLGEDQGKDIQYQWVATPGVAGSNEIQKCQIQNSSPINCVAVTAPQINVQHFNLYVNGAGNDGKQPSIIMMIQGVATAGDNTAPFAMQTFISQRAAE